MSKGGRENTMHSTSGFFFVFVCMHVQMRESMTEREREEGVFLHGDPSGSGFLKTGLYFMKVLFEH